MQPSPVAAAYSRTSPRLEAKRIIIIHDLARSSFVMSTNVAFDACNKLTTYIYVYLSPTSPLLRITMVAASTHHPQCHQITEQIVHLSHTLRLRYNLVIGLLLFLSPRASLIISITDRIVDSEHIRHGIHWTLRSISALGVLCVASSRSTNRNLLTYLLSSQPTWKSTHVQA